MPAAGAVSLSFLKICTFCPIYRSKEIKLTRTRGGGGPLPSPCVCVSHLPALLWALPLSFSPWNECSRPGPDWSQPPEPTSAPAWAGPSSAVYPRLLPHFLSGDNCQGLQLDPWQPWLGDPTVTPSPLLPDAPEGDGHTQGPKVMGQVCGSKTQIYWTAKHKTTPLHDSSLGLG